MRPLLIHPIVSQVIISPLQHSPLADVPVSPTVAADLAHAASVQNSAQNDLLAADAVQRVDVTAD